MKRVALYMRVSTDQQAQHGDSLREQRDTLIEYVNSQKDMIIQAEYVDDGISGQKLQRDEFQNLLSDVQDNKIDIILFTKLDRWFRNLRHYLNTQEILEKHNVSWNAVSQQYYDTSTAYGRTFIAQVMSFAELEAQMTSERIKAVFQNKIDRGEVVSGKVPLGYSIKDKKLVLNEDKELIIKIFNHFVETGSLRGTCHYMHDELNISRDYQSVRKMLTNRKYIGELRNNKNYCPAIIEKSVFDQAQSLLSKNIKNNSKRTYLFTGLLKCSECGRKFSATTTIRNYTKKTGDITVTERKFYRCPKSKNNVSRCSNKTLLYEIKVEKYVLENIQNELAKSIVNYDNTKKVQKTDNTKRKNIESKLKRLKEAYLNEIIDLNEYKIDREKLTSQLDSIEKEKPSTKKKDLQLISSFLSKDFFQQYSILSEEEKRSAWRSLISKIEVNQDGDLKLFFN